MKITSDNLLIHELKKYKLCRWFWSEELDQELSKEIHLDYEPTGEMGFYSQYFEFCAPYQGTKKELSDTQAKICLGITAGNSQYDIQKAIKGIDCFHNVRIQVFQNKNIILSSKFQLWSQEKEEYSGKEDILNLILKE